jgi:hypothetical protein
MTVIKRPHWRQGAGFRTASEGMLSRAVQMSGDSLPYAFVSISSRFLFTTIDPIVCVITNKSRPVVKNQQHPSCNEFQPTALGLELVPRGSGNETRGSQRETDQEGRQSHTTRMAGSCLCGSCCSQLLGVVSCEGGKCNNGTPAGSTW